jgi:hypothetical protein
MGRDGKALSLKKAPATFHYHRCHPEHLKIPRCIILSGTRYNLQVGSRGGS